MPTRGFFNGTGVCLRVEGREGGAARARARRPAAGWQVATTLAPQPGGAAHEFVAADYDELVDHPVELGRFWRGSFSAAGIAARVRRRRRLARLRRRDACSPTRKRICETAIAFWHGTGGKAPFDRYLFLLNAVDDGRGGLEHRASTALVAPRRDLPRRADRAAQAAPRTARPQTEPRATPTCSA